MARLDCPCERCVPENQRVTEEFLRREDAVVRIADLSAKGMLHNACSCDDRVWLVCYRGVRSSSGEVLPRYEGQMLNVP